MTDKELIQALCDENITGVGDMKDCMEEAAGRLVALLAENEWLKSRMPEWVRVEDGLPETEDYVLVTVDGKIGNKEYIDGYLLAEYVFGCGWILEEYPQWEDANVTHWMPLPEPPSSKGVE